MAGQLKSCWAVAAMPALTTAQPRPWLTLLTRWNRSRSQHHPQADLLAGGGLVQVAAKRMVVLGQDQGEILQVRQGQRPGRGAEVAGGPSRPWGWGGEAGRRGPALMLGEQLVKAEPMSMRCRSSCSIRGGMGHHAEVQADLG